MTNTLQVVLEVAACNALNIAELVAIANTLSVVFECILTNTLDVVLEVAVSNALDVFFQAAISGQVLRLRCQFVRANVLQVALMTRWSHFLNVDVFGCFGKSRSLLGLLAV